MKIRRVLIANRGEISCRIQRTLRAMGIGTAVVHSSADRDALFVREAERAQEIGPPPAKESYLNADKIVAAARALEADAVHPGYGFLSENADFAARCEAAGLVFLGPPSSAIRAMGDKTGARRLAVAADVPVVPGYDGPDDDLILARESTRIGFPQLVKAAHGGGGKGLKKVASAEEFASALASARREAGAAFGSSRVLLERFVRPARHIEVQILADRHGETRAILERECSLQRRHQKVIEECPSAMVTDELRAELGAAAIRLARQVGYVSAGTVEFLLEPDGRFWFLEMNTRLQVEHGVTELVTGLDLVAWQVRIAEGEALRLPTPLVPRGHAIEARLYAEDPTREFLPQTGQIHHLRLPEGPGLRIDRGVVAGQTITPHYDPMLMKILAHGETREMARLRLILALRELEILGVVTNGAYLRELLESDCFTGAKTFTHSLDEWPKLEPRIPAEVLALLAAHGALPRASTAAKTNEAAPLPDLFETVGPFRIVGGSTP